MKTKQPPCVPALLLFAALSLQLTATPVGTAFTYQGRLNTGGNPASGLYDLRFTLYSDAATGAQVGKILTNAATGVSNGLFTVALDFGNVFDGNARWLEIAVRTNGSGAFTSLAPRQQLTPTPYALFAPNAGTAASASLVAAANISGTIPLAKLPAAVVTNNATGVTLNGSFSGNGSGLTGLSPANLSPGTAAINISGNATTATTATNLFGNVTDAQIPANFARLNGTNNFTGTNAFAGVTLATNVNNVLVGRFTGNGAGLTNLSGVSGQTNWPVSALTNLTTTSNSFVGSFTGNAAGLTNLFSGLIASNYSVLVPGPGGFQTNTIPLSGGMLVVNNSNSGGTVGAQTNYLGLWEQRSQSDSNGRLLLDWVPQAGVPLDDIGYGIIWGVSSTASAPQDFLQVFLNPAHSGAGSSVAGAEMQIVSGGNWALSPGFQNGVARHFQWGIGGGHAHQRTGVMTSNYWSYGQACGAFSNAPGYAWAWTDKAKLADGTDRFPGWLAQSWTNDVYGFGGRWELTWMHDLNVAFGNTSDTWDIDTISRGAGLYKFTSGALRGMDLRGGLVQENQNRSTSSTNIVLDFGTSVSTVISVSADTVTLSTTNAQWGNTNYERRVFLLKTRAGPISQITYPAWVMLMTGWTAPTNLDAAAVLRLELESFGPGETNKVLVSARSTSDPGFAWNSVATNYFARAGITNTTEKSAYNAFLSSLATAGILTNLDALYLLPMEANYGFNAITNRYDINWINSPTHAVTLGSGVSFYGTNQFGSTGLNPIGGTNRFNTNSASLIAYYDDDSSVRGAIVVAQGSGATARAGLLRYNSGWGELFGLNYYVVGYVSTPVTANGLWIYTRTALSHQIADVVNSTAVDTGTNATSLPNDTFLIGARNGPPAETFLTGRLRLVAIGGGLTAQNITDLKAAVAALKDALGWP